MVAFLDTHEEIGAIGPVLLNDDRQTIQYWGGRNLPRPLDTFFEFSKLSQLFPKSGVLNRYLIGNWDHSTPREVECLSGSCMLVRSQTVQDVGLLDEGYPLYCEDTDWCHRIGLSGWKLYYPANARLVHLGQRSSLQDRGPATIKTVSGVYRYYRKFHGRRPTLLVWLLIFMVSLAKSCAWMGIFLVRASRREAAAKQIRAYLRICQLSPFRAASWP
jgi:GT2 family glycosyltransferase